MHPAFKDFRNGFRILTRAPGFSAVAILTLALGIGANTAIFGVVNAVLLRPLAMAQPERVVLLQEEWRGVDGGGVSVGNFSDLRAQNTVFEKFTALASASFNLSTTDVPERVSAAR